MFDGQVTADLCLYSYLDIVQFLMDKLLEIFLFAVICVTLIQDIVFWTSHRRVLSSQLLVQNTVNCHLLPYYETNTCLSCLKSFRQAVRVMIFKTEFPPILLMLLTENRCFV